MPSKDFKFSRTASMMKAEETSQKDEPCTINNPSWINNDVKQATMKGGSEPMKQKEGSTMKKIRQNALLVGDKLKES